MDSKANYFLNELELAEMLGVAVPTVRRWRLLKQGPKYLKLGSAVRYRRADILSWLDSRPSGGETVQEITVESVVA